MSKRLNPYQRLLNEIKDFCSKILYRHEKIMWRYPINRLNDTWKLGEVYQRVAAADQLGYDVMLIADQDGLLVKYVKKLPRIPWMWQ